MSENRITQEKRHNTTLYIKKRINEDYNGKVIYIGIMGSDLYGWSSKDSDVDWRGIFLTGTENLLGLWHKRDHLTELKPRDVVMNELAKELNLLLKGNCNALERIYSNPFYKTTEFYKLKEIVDRSLHRTGPYNSYKGLATENYNKFIKGGKASTYKKWLYVIRALKAGIHYLSHGQVQPDINLIPSHYYDEIDYLVDRKINGSEYDEAVLPDGMRSSLDEIVTGLLADLDTAYEVSDLPLTCPDEVKQDAHKWLITLRTRKIGR